MGYPFVPAKWFTPGPRTRGGIIWIVLHTTEAGTYPDHPADATRIARADQTRSDKVSTHYAVDGTQIIQCVRLEDVAYAAPGANAQGVQIEQCAFARWDLDHWNRHVDMLEHTAQLLADLHSRLGIPLRHVGIDGLNARMAGVTTHAEVNAVFQGSTHTDPGASYPMDSVIARAIAIGGTPPAVVIPGPPPVLAGPTSLEGNMLAFDLESPPDNRGRFKTYEVVTNDGGKEWWVYAWNGATFAKPELQGNMQDGTTYQVKRITLPPGEHPTAIVCTTDRVYVGGQNGATYAYDRHL